MSIINEVTLSELEFSNRIDSEFYNPILKRSLFKLIDSGYLLKKLKQCCQIRSGTTPIDRDDSLTEGPILLKTTDIRNNVLDPAKDYYHISKQIFERMSRTQLKDNDVLLNIVGATLDVIGRAGIYVGFNADANITQAMVYLRIHSDILIPGYLFSYLCTKYAQDQVKRFARPTGQYNLNIPEVENIIIPIIPEDHQQEIHDLIIDAGNKQKTSSNLFNESREVISTELGLDKLSIDKFVGYETRFREIINGRRFDSQCYKPEFIGYQKHLTANHRIEHLLSLVSMSKGTQMSAFSEGDIRYCSIKDIDGVELVSSEFCANSEKTCIAERRELLLAVTGATIGKIGIVERYEKIAHSGDLLALKTNERIDPYYLLAVLASPIGLSQCQRWTTGSTNGHLAPKDVGKFVIPRLDKPIEEKIAKLVMASLQIKKESEEIIEQAKERVEELIEKKIE